MSYIPLSYPIVIYLATGSLYYATVAAAGVLIGYLIVELCF